MEKFYNLRINQTSLGVFGSPHMLILRIHASERGFKIVSGTFQSHPFVSVSIGGSVFLDDKLSTTILLCRDAVRELVEYVQHSLGYCAHYILEEPPGEISRTGNIR